MYCKNCFAEIDENSRSCPHCSAVQNESVSKGENQIETTPKQRKKLSKKLLLIMIAAPILCLIVGLSLSSPSSKQETANYKNDTELAKSCAITQIQKQVFAKDNSVYDIVVVDSDGFGKFIITATTKPGAFETWWAVLVQLNNDNETYYAKANYHGNGVTQDQWIEKYKTDDYYSWGVEQEQTQQQ